MSETIYYGSKSLVEIGNVGIGTKTPVTALDVVGSIRQSSLPVLYVYKSTPDQTIATATAITFASTNYNTQWTLTSTSRFTLTGPSGYYLIRARLSSTTSFAYLSASIRVNGTERAGPYGNGPGTSISNTYTEVVWLLNTNDYIEVFGIPSASLTIQSSTDTRTAFQAVYLSGTT
jgi:hypothetical protein